MYSGTGSRACDVPQHGELIGFLSAMCGRKFHSCNLSRYFAPSSLTLFVSHTHVFTFCLHSLTMVDRQTRSAQHQRNIFFGHYFSLFLRMFLRSCSCCFWCSSMFRLHSSFSFSISSIWSASWRLSSSARFISSLAFLSSSVNLRFSSRISLTLSGFVLFFLSMLWVSASNCRLAYAGLLLISCCHSSTFQGYHLSYMSFLPGYRQRRSVNTWLHFLSVFLPRTPPISSISLDFVVAYQNISFPSTDFGFKVKFV